MRRLHDGMVTMEITSLLKSPQGLMQGAGFIQFFPGPRWKQ